MEISLFLERPLFQALNHAFQQALVNGNYTEEKEDSSFDKEFHLLFFFFHNLITQINLY